MNRCVAKKPGVAFLAGLFAGCITSWILKESILRFFVELVKKEPVTVETQQTEQNEIDEDEIPEECPGVESEMAGKSDACEGCPNKKICASGEATQEDPAVVEIANRLSNVKHKILVLSGKGGVGKSTVASQLGWSLQKRGFQVGLLDVDICGPSIAKMTGCDSEGVHPSADGWSPVAVEDNFLIMSIAFLIPDRDSAVVWRGPKKNGLIRQFLTDVLWGELDFLIIDTPPGTSDEHLSLVSYLKNATIDGAIIVTTPQEVALLDVRKEINFCKKSGIGVLGVVENMTGSVFSSISKGGVDDMCKSMEVSRLGCLSLTEELIASCEAGRSVLENFPASQSASEVGSLTDQLLNSLNHPLQPPQEKEKGVDQKNVYVAAPAQSHRTEK
eukprot:Lankesteria_metandrocarpae@DN5232_c0_g1_i2.p1